MAPPAGFKSSHIDFGGGGGSAAAKRAKKTSSEASDASLARKGRQPPPAGADGGKPLFGALTMAPLAQVFKDGGSKPPTAADVALVFTPVVLQHLIADPVGPEGVSLAMGLTNPYCWSSRCWSRPCLPSATAWSGQGCGLKDDFDADFRRLGQADLNRMELPQVGDKAVAHGDVVGMSAANEVYTSSYHSPKGSYQELLLQKEKAKKRASAGGSVAGGDAAASDLIFEYCDLLFKALREQRSCFKEQRTQGGAALSRESHQRWCRR
jgi:hypothetical protein